jgi:hypothetical protein
LGQESHQEGEQNIMSDDISVDLRIELVKMKADREVKV